MYLHIEVGFGHEKISGISPSAVMGIILWPASLMRGFSIKAAVGKHRPHV